MMEYQARPFDMETVFVKAKKQRTKKFRGMDLPLYTVIWPMIYAVRMFGFAPYDFMQDRLMPSNVYLIFTIIFVTLNSYIMYTVIENIMGVNQNDPILGGTENSKVIFNNGVLMYELGLVMLTRRKFVSTWNALQDYDESVRQLGYPRKETRTAIVAWMLAIVITIIWVVVNRSGMYAFFETWSYNMGYLLPYVGTSIALYKFVGMAFFLGQRFHHLNTIAMKTLPPASTKSKSATTLSRKTILSLHNDLMIAAENFESLYSWSLLLWLANLCLHAVSNIYFIITWLLIQSWKDIFLPLIYCLGTWLVSFIYQLLLLSAACDYASSQANCMAPILIEWQVRLMKKNEEHTESLLQFLNRRLNFSAGGCFYVNLPLLRSIASLTTTYLVILLQFHGGDN
ncbi:uncharacterized protein LOC109856935 [Pseudomyrmex gracilis]|uniref:uncharacterized protein LOC109856935 n=1 Tax=Pseudomyrmex gracilis TaxID=219809 RepID=UPI0009957462|nr:uncharacterized protein LOC109856935 [Pseudomyrmex gracilis]